jgi:hypothetical protein
MNESSVIISSISQFGSLGGAGYEFEATFVDGNWQLETISSMML